MINWCCKNCEKCEGCRQIVCFQNCMYVVVGKAASSAIVKTIGYEQSFVPFSEVVNFEGFKFSFVRNPWNRLVSCYKHWIVGRPSTPLIFRRNDELYPNMEFDEFVEVVVNTPDERSDEHFISQSSLLMDDGNLVVDFVGKVEHSADDWKVVQKHVDVDDLFFINSSKLKFDDSQYFHLKEAVYQRFENDYLNFGYTL